MNTYIINNSIYENKIDTILLSSIHRQHDFYYYTSIHNLSIDNNLINIYVYDNSSYLNYIHHLNTSLPNNINLFIKNFNITSEPHHLYFLKTSNSIVEIFLPNLYDVSNIFMNIYSKENQQLIKTLSIENFIKKLPNCKIKNQTKIHFNCSIKKQSNIYSCKQINIEKSFYYNKHRYYARPIYSRTHSPCKLFTTINIQTIENNQMIITEYCIAVICYTYLYHVVHIWNMNTTELLDSYL
jgi:hypothetical protein